MEVGERCRVLAAASNKINLDDKNNLGFAVIRYIGQLPEFTGYWVYI